MTFALPHPTTVILVHMNIRSERHGDDPATAIDLKLRWRVGNDRLDLFDPSLHTALYYRAQETDDQADIAGVPAIALNLRFPKLAPLAWMEEIVGATVTIDFGLSEIILSNCRVDKFRIEPFEGGSCDITFRVQTSSLPDGALDKLGQLLACEATIRVAPPEPARDAGAASGQLTIDGTVGHPGASQASAGDEFARIHRAG